MIPLIKKIPGSNIYGKRVLIISGVHGNELTPLLTTQMLSTDICNYKNILSFYAEIVIITGINELAIKSKTRGASLPNTDDMNRKSSDKEDIITIAKDYIKNADIVIDIHSSPDITEMFLINQDVYAEVMYKVMLLSSQKYCFRPFNGDTIKNYTLGLGKIGFTLELNGIDFIDKMSARKGYSMVIDLLGVIYDMELIKGDIDPRFTLIDVISYSEGIIDFYHSPGDMVSKDEVIYNIKNYEGIIIYTHKSPCFALIIGIEKKSWVNVSDNVMLIQPIPKHQYAEEILPL